MKNLMAVVLLVLVLAAPARTQAQTNVGTNRVEIAKGQVEEPMKKFKELTGTADRIVIREGWPDKYLLVITNATEIAEFNALLDFKAESGGRCRCRGYPGIGWYRKGDPVALTSMHHGRALRWDGLKDGDCLFTDESKAKLADWFRAHLPKLADDPRCKDWLEPKDKKKGKKEMETP